MTSIDLRCPDKLEVHCEHHPSLVIFSLHEDRWKVRLCGVSEFRFRFSKSGLDVCGNSQERGEPEDCTVKVWVEQSEVHFELNEFYLIVGHTGLSIYIYDKNLSVEKIWCSSEALSVELREEL